jgi:hypothetical protein
MIYELTLAAWDVLFKKISIGAEARASATNAYLRRYERGVQFLCMRSLEKTKRSGKTKWIKKVEWGESGFGCCILKSTIVPRASNRRAFLSVRASVQKRKLNAIIRHLLR